MNNQDTTTKMIVTFPSSRVLDVVEMLIQTQAALAAMGDVMSLHVSKDGRGPALIDTVVADIEGDTAELPEFHERRVQATPAQAARRSRKVKTVREGSNQVVYRVIDPRIVMGRVPHEVRMCLLQYGPLSAKEVEAKTGKGQKSVESALYGLRAAGSVESVPVEEGKQVTQRKFTKGQVKQGTPLTV